MYDTVAVCGRIHRIRGTQNGNCSPGAVRHQLGREKGDYQPSNLPKSRLPDALRRRNIEVYGGPDTKQHSNNTSTQNVKCAACIGTRIPMHYVRAVAK